jgi:F0F1-type ATP synthase assembly protein I
MDWSEACRILGVTESATDEEIKDQYFYKVQLLHPDKNQDKPESIRKRAETELASINQAYSFATNPDNNPYKIPPKLSIEPGSIRFKDIKIGMKKRTTLVIKNTGGPYTSIWIDNQPAPWLTVAEIKSISSERLPLEVALECTGTGEPDKQYSCDLCVKLENENTHSVDQAMVKFELYTISESTANDNRKNDVPPPIKPEVEVPRDKSAKQPVIKNRRGFSFVAFMFNLLAFAVVGMVLYYFVDTFFKYDESLFLIILVLFSLLAFGLSFNQGITLGSKTGSKKARPV